MEHRRRGWGDGGQEARQARRRLKLAGTTKPHGLDPTTSDRDYSQEELDFMLAMHEYGKNNHRPFPTWSEALAVLKGLGDRK
jgi:hypothetical protein